MTPEEARRILRARCGKPKETMKFDLYTTPNGRQLLALNEPRYPIWLIEGHASEWVTLVPSAVRVEPYEPDGDGHSNRPPSLREPNPVTKLRMSAAASVQDVEIILDAYDAPHRSQPSPATHEAKTAMPDPEPSRAPVPNNLILYGPPGTGKTFATVERAVRLCDGDASDDRSKVEARFRELLSNERIAFVTFHQTYGYEDFLEGLRPPTSDESAIGDDEGEGVGRLGLTLDVRDGVFKRLAKRAASSSSERSTKVASTRADGTPRTIWKMSLGATFLEDEAEIFDHCVAHGEIALGWGDPVDWSDNRFERIGEIEREWRTEIEEDAPRVRMRMLHQLRNEMRDGDLVIVSDGNSRFRAVAEVTGPYRYDDVLGSYAQRRPVRWLRIERDGIDFSTITQTGVTQRSLYRMRDVNLAALLELLEPVGSSGAPKPYVLIIDEINRANVSKVFGELITLLEVDKRAGAEHELSVTLPFSGERFAVPPNLHLIGTMNTADRSIALLDTALRRRFTFEEIGPDPSLLGTVDGIDLRAILRTLNERVEYLFDRDHAIGHAFFIGCGSRAEIDAVMRGKIIPLLAEYFHEDWDKVRAVLGETTDEGAFVRRRRLAPPPGQDAMGERFTYIVREAFAPNAYDRLLGRVSEPAAE